MPGDVRSQKQARYFGAIVGGKARKKGGPSKRQARKALRGTKVKRLPKRKG